MDLLLLILIVLAVLSVGGWGYGYYSTPAVAPGGTVVAAPAYATPLGILGVLVVIALCVMLFTGWRVYPVW